MNVKESSSISEAFNVMLMSCVSKIVIVRFVMFMLGFEFFIAIAELLTKSLQLLPSKTLTLKVQFSSFVVFIGAINVLLA